ncbi:MAG: hypothetical protein NTV68_00070 [Methanomicrobiales archaeon]|nr:hypothetical protein [Methanomicrobiales archaeon]
MPIKQREFSKAALKKGFVAVKQSEHCYFYLKNPDDKITHIRTKMGQHGNVKDISDDLLSVMYKQLHFESKNEMMRFIDCTKSYDEYIASLKAHNII